MSTVSSDRQDANLWESANQDDQSAFEILVQRHQSAVCAVAYNACGNLSLSEDIAQETFWTAWKNRRSLLDPSRLRAWLCGIARNIGRNSRRRTPVAVSSMDELPEPVATADLPLDQAVSHEEERLVWKALEQIPETYREPLILFYRENQSVAEVAATLELSIDAVKQRLSRGRNLLRDQVAETVEGALRRSAPRGRFTVSVMAGLASATAASGTALAGTGGSMAAIGLAAKTAPVVSTMGMAGAIGGVAGAAGGLLGGWLGAWVPAQFAPTNRERLKHLEFGRRMLIVSLILLLILAGVMFAFAKTMSPAMLITVTVGWVLVLNLYILVEIYLLIVAIRKIRQETPPESDPNDSWLKSYVERNVVSQWEGRTYRSTATLLGLPLIDIQVSSPNTGGIPDPPKKARGWIAIGDRADGILLAIGGIARGGIAMGGLSIGLLSFGGMSLGLVSVGGGAIGAIALGGLAIGGIAFGGGAIGWQAAGGGAIAWDVACGGGAMAHHAAYGGAATAHDLAAGGSASALHANDEIAKEFFKNHWMVQSMEWMNQNQLWTQFILIVVCVIPPIAGQLLFYRRRQSPEVSADGSESDRSRL